MPAKLKITSRAPTRIDLAGGTLDLWPLYLFLDSPSTLNLGIDLFAEVTLEQTPKTRVTGEILLRSEDQNLELRFPWDFLKNPLIHIPSALALHFKILQQLAPKEGMQGLDLTVTSRAGSPAGAGLGGSSTLAIALAGAMSDWSQEARFDPQIDGVRLIELVRDVESSVIQVPAGVQDYYGAMFGGLQALRWGAGTHTREHLPAAILKELESRLVLVYSGQSRNSGINNWALYKSFIDNEDGVRNRFQAIAKATGLLENALRTANWAAVGEAISAEWALRRGLARQISTPELDGALEEAQTVGKVAGKICGAGGGGCFFAYVPSGKTSEKDAVKEIFSKRGMTVLPFSAVAGGLEVRRSTENSAV